MTIPTTETMAFEIILRAEFWDKPPGVEIFVNDQSLFNGLIDNSCYTINFSSTVDLNAEHQLSIRRFNKTTDQTRYDGQQLLDQLLYIDRISVDGINIRNIIWSKSWNEPVYPEPWATEQRSQGIELQEKIPAETCLGHNGIWRLNFSSPFYKFIMDWMG